MIEIIKAYVEGKTIEYRELNCDNKPWTPKNEYKGNIAFYPNDFEYRIKPEIAIKYVLAAHFEEAVRCGRTMTHEYPCLHQSISGLTPAIKLTFEDKKLTKAEVI